MKMSNYPLFRYLQITVIVLFFIGGSKLNGYSGGQTNRLKGAPFYKTYGKKTVAVNNAAGYAPIGFDETVTSEFSYAGREQSLQPLADAMNAYLDSLSWHKPLVGDPLPKKGTPYVYVGSSEGEGAPPAAAMERVEHDKYPPMVIHIQKPSSAWRTALRELIQTQRVDYVLWIKLGFSEYPKADKGLFGKKVVLGTGYEEGIRFLSAIDKPVEVLQITGMLLDRDSNIVRAGAEGILVKDTPFWAQIFEVQQAMNNEALQRLIHDERREDLAGKPLKWQVALHNLLAQLLSQSQKVIN